jgi:serine/threonine protein kinase/Tol biopolymer transport system component
MIGAALANYRITAALGEGGMGQVWRAEDTKLGREVALKVLPEEFAQDPERMARFEREAKVLASLNHPNIATLYGLETTPVIPSEGSPEEIEKLNFQHSPASGDPSTSASLGDASAQDDSRAVTFLAMELVEGEDLSERILRGAIPVEEAIPIALQIAEALEAAHEQGIVHRDLKPANIKLRPDGTVKVLDFGLAKAWDADAADSGLSLSPTVTRHATAAGVILGTASYMSPEQARGTSVDRRADIWSFGVVVWEMLTGQKLFEGVTVSDILASVLKEAPSLDALPSNTPASVHKLVARCLDKDPKTRLRDIGEARIVLENPDEADLGEETAIQQVDKNPWRRRMGWMTTAVAGTLALVLGVLLLGRAEPEERVIRFETPPPPEGWFHLAPDNPGPVAVSPDGRMLAYSGRSTEGLVQLWVRALDEAAARPLSGTDNAQYPFWSPDSRRIGFFSGNKLRVVDAAGGPPLALCDASDGKGGTWNEDGVIVFAPSYNSPLHRVSQVGGESVPVTEFNVERKDNSHRHPRFLPGGKHFLYMARSATGSAEGHAVVVGSMDGVEEKVLFRAPAGVEYASGHILFARDTTLLARPFDAKTLEFDGESVPLAEVVTLLAPGTVVGVYSASQNGVLAYQARQAQDGAYRLVWRDREGNELGILGEPGSYDEVHILPGGELAAVALEEGGIGDVWVIDLRRELFTRFTFDPGYESGLTPSPNGDALFYSAEKNGVYALVKKEIGGSGEGVVLFESTTEMYPSSVSPDGRHLAFFKGGDDSSWDIWILPLAGESEAYEFIQSDFGEAYAMFSPDGKWLTYMSNESGRPEIYVMAFPEPGRKWQISTDGGLSPRWRKNGTEIVYHANDGTLTAVSVEARDGGLLIGEAKELFNTRLQPAGSHLWSMAPDGERFLALETMTEHNAPNLSVVVNWLKERGGS